MIDERGSTWRVGQWREHFVVLSSTFISGCVFVFGRAVVSDSGCLRFWSHRLFCSLIRGVCISCSFFDQLCASFRPLSFLGLSSDFVSWLVVWRHCSACRRPSSPLVLCFCPWIYSILPASSLAASRGRLLLLYYQHWGRIVLIALSKSFILFRLVNEIIPTGSKGMWLHSRVVVAYIS